MNENQTFNLLKVIHPDIIGVSWDGDWFDIITQTGEKMCSMEFTSDSITRNVMVAVEDFLSENNVLPFEVRG